MEGRIIQIFSFVRIGLQSPKYSYSEQYCLYCEQLYTKQSALFLVKSRTEAGTKEFTSAVN